MPPSNTPQKPLNPAAHRKTLCACDGKAHSVTEWQTPKNCNVSTWQPLTTVAHHSHLTGFHDIYGIYGLICERATVVLHPCIVAEPLVWFVGSLTPGKCFSVNCERWNSISLSSLSHCQLYYPHFASEFPTFCENEDEDEQNEHDDEHYVEHEDEDEDENDDDDDEKKSKKKKKNKKKKKKKKKKKRKKEKTEKKRRKRRRRRLRMRMKINRMKKQKKKKKDIMMIMNTIPALDPPCSPSELVSSFGKSICNSAPSVKRIPISDQGPETRSKTTTSFAVLSG